MALDLILRKRYTFSHFPLVIKPWQFAEGRQEEIESNMIGVGFACQRPDDK